MEPKSPRRHAPACFTRPPLDRARPAARRFVPVRSCPEGCLVNARPRRRRAGNPETSSRITDVVFAALGRVWHRRRAGTMNNVVFGSDRFTYYETIGGGQGACPDADGPSAVHVAMSNTLNTPVEAVELSYPLRVERYALRLGSGGASPRRRRGHAEGARAVPALAPHAAAAALSSTRGGADSRRSSERDELPHRARPGPATSSVETPGGGGPGAPD
jgi:N-methylhydantoinase B